MQMIETSTRLDSGKDCIKFIERREEENWLRIDEGVGCWSYMGKFATKGPQQVTLQSPQCLKSKTVAHELIHALGFNHEQSRPDRDAWVTINVDNIEPRQRHNFAKSENEKFPTNSSYDYNSIMHYAKNAFAIVKTNPTIVGKHGEIKPGNNLSRIDVQEIRNLYNCSGIWQLVFI
jgi:hypothetical protein